MYTKEERLLRLIEGKSVDYLPSQITLADRSRDKELSEMLGLSSADELDDYLENHFHITLSYNDKTLFYRNDRDEMNRLQELGFCGADWENKIVYDSWGMGIQVDSDGFFDVFHPLQGKTTERNASFMPPDVNKQSLFCADINEAVDKFNTPDLDRAHNFDDMKKDLAEKSGDFLVLPSGYFGIYERSYAFMGFQELMLNFALHPKAVHNLLDKITDYRVEFAKRVVEMGFKVGHHGDDRGRAQERFDAHVRQSGEGAGSVVRVQRGEDEVACQGGLDRVLRGLQVADLADEHHVGVLTQDRP